MRIDDFKRNWAWVHRMTIDFMQAVPDGSWRYTPAPEKFGSLSRQFRHVVNGRGVYNSALHTRKVDWSSRDDRYTGALTRDDLLSALDAKQREFLAALETVDVVAPIWYGETAFTFDNFLCEVIQHESIHHGQWSVYAAVGGFETPQSWKTGWKM
jgi:uncharacterized damage-inducible protein DinB